MTTLHLVRHGESEWNAHGLVQGQRYDVPLTARGRDQALDVARRVAVLGPTYVVTSDLLRAVQTAEAIEAGTGLVASRDERLRERSYGEDEGRPRREVIALGDPDLVSLGGEPFADVVARVRDWLADLERTQPDAVVVAVTHGDVISAAVVCLDLPRTEAHHDNASIVTIDRLSDVRA